MAVEVTLILRFEASPDELSIRQAIEEGLDCVVVEWAEEEV